MALILDKTLTGITMIDGNGDVLTGFTNLTYTDTYGNVHENPYLVVDAVIINKFTTFAKVYISIYKDSTSRSQRKKPLLEEHYVVQGTKYNEYFNVSNMEDINIFERGYDYIGENIYVNWKSDE